MYPSLFDKLLNLVGTHLLKDPTKRPIDPPQRLIITLHYLAEGCSMQEMSYSHMLGKTTVANIIKETTKVLWEVLQPIYLKPPTRPELLQIADAFNSKWNLPHCVGAIDGKHVVIQAPPMSGSTYFNYKKTFSINLMAACDAEYRFIFVDAGAPGGDHDASVFRESGFGSRILQDQLNLPHTANLPNTKVEFPYFFAADAAFPLHENIMRPYPGDKLSDAQKIFNYRLSRGRRTIENAFGILSQRLRVLRRPIIANVDLCEQITLSCVVLHNFIKYNEDNGAAGNMRYCPPGFADVINGEGTVSSGTWRQYLNSPEGSVPWQEEVIWRGAMPNTK
ncbi:protein ALP1-like [Photinus pyralis]|uniref:protein ALP1-like n=1 Tax=Photinus pyralis TaxID=7054 RepID=UPI0012677DE1|nr:protein ALP1-like [Photinus pyralis]